MSIQWPTDREKCSLANGAVLQHALMQIPECVNVKLTPVSHQDRNLCLIVRFGTWPVECLS